MDFETFLTETNKLNETLTADLAKVDAQIIAAAESKSAILDNHNKASNALVEKYGKAIEAEGKKKAADEALANSAKLASK